jgi:hypothetical protein
MKAFENSAHLPNTVSDTMLREVNKPPMAEYYVVENGDRQWLGRMRITTGGLNAVLVDALDVLPGASEKEIASLLLDAARTVAHQQNRLLTVVAPQSAERWAAYGFTPVSSALGLAG